jgi:hypothetical protein
MAIKDVNVVLAHGAWAVGNRGGFDDAYQVPHGRC